MTANPSEPRAEPRIVSTAECLDDSSEARVERHLDAELDRMSPEAELARKVRWGKVFALMETVFYAVLIPLMVRHFFFHDNSTANAFARRIVAYFHGFVVMGFCYMVFDLRRLLRWSWPFFVFALLPVGSLFAHARLRRWEGELRRGSGLEGPSA